MEYLNITDIDIRNKKIIGTGTTARCYKLKDGSVLKLFKHNYRAFCLLDKELFKNDLNHFKNITNDTFIGPNKVVLDKNNKINGYIYPYVNGKSFDKLSNNEHFLEVYKNYKQVLIDICKISDEKFSLFDVHPGNIIYDGNIHIIDLDKGFFDNDSSIDFIYKNNCYDVFRSTFGRIYHKKVYEELEFKDKKIDSLYREICTTSIDDINMFLDYIKFYCGNNNPTIGDIKDKVKVKKIVHEFF